MCRWRPEAAWLVITLGSPDEFAKFRNADMVRSQKIIADGNIRVE